MWTESHAHSCALYLIKPNARLLGVRIPAWSMNWFFLSHYPLHAAVALAAGGMATRRCQEAYAKLDAIRAEINAIGATWQVGEPFQMRVSWVGKLGLMAKAFDRFLDSLSNHFKMHLALHISVALVFLPTAFAYLYILRKHLRMAVHQRGQTVELSVNNRYDRIRVLKTASQVDPSTCLSDVDRYCADTTCWSRLCSSSSRPSPFFQQPAGPRSGLRLSVGTHTWQISTLSRCCEYSKAPSTAN
jgi:hypothetical protein